MKVATKHDSQQFVPCYAREEQYTCYSSSSQIRFLSSSSSLKLGTATYYEFASHVDSIKETSFGSLYDCEAEQVAVGTRAPG